MYPVRNIELCTKDCLCLFVCPTGATNTETGQIDPDKCMTGCRACVDACPSHAITLVPKTYPKQQGKTDEVLKVLKTLSESKVIQERIALGIESKSEDPLKAQLAKAIARSNRVMNEDIKRESAFMLPQSEEALKFLNMLIDGEKTSDLPVDKIKRLIELLQ